jgi:3-hydroxyisobutyrate dehydrogenase-like beta-hydroxyacid dehydrogenase
MKIAILGGGHGCYAAAADLSEQGHEVRLWRRDAAALQPVIDHGGITLKDAQGSARGATWRWPPPTSAPRCAAPSWC